jgi:hypothetical protein
MGQYFSSEPIHQKENEDDYDFHQTIIDKGVEFDEEFYLDFISHLLIKYKRLKQEINRDTIDEPLIDERIF